MANNPKPQPNEWYVVRNSQIHGRGLYARKAIPKDTWIVEYVGERVDKDESDRRANALLDEAKENDGARVYMFILNDEWDIDGNVSWNTARLMNHSCEPNVEAQTWDEQEIWFVALRDIKKGEELTFNYGFDLECWEDHPCRCGTASCVGYIAGDDYWPALKKKVASKKAREEKKALAAQAVKKVAKGKKSVTKKSVAKEEVAAKKTVTAKKEIAVKKTVAKSVKAPAKKKQAAKKSKPAAK
ncbi:SET domain-containing protein-lysine N-methyltransferase [Verrucomicrobium sp. BvORR034]|uniref:SET domain-containing protein n=1 Tax=Verrucomicrobium sp. BvORR034 TaxID=1396418 RepID=UPI0007C638B9|nr:SET domain-containing protein-lysine N-methyltransferase [Verrucomicrobium sp. BvORR034]